MVTAFGLEQLGVMLTAPLPTTVGRAMRSAPTSVAPEVIVVPCGAVMSTLWPIIVTTTGGDLLAVASVTHTWQLSADAAALVRSNATEVLSALVAAYA